MTPLSKAKFFGSALTEYPLLKDLSGLPMKEVAIVGRSNVGKSSLINHLFKNKTLARTSATPGKTQLINFFTVDDNFALVDLPGYGYAKVSKAIKDTWGNAIDDYLKKRKELKLVLFLLDIRREVREEDLLFLQWLEFHKKPALLIFTKCDKFSPSTLTQTTKELYTSLSTSYPYLTYSIKSEKMRLDLIHKLSELLRNPHGTYP